MRRITDFLLRHRVATLVTFAVLLAISAVLTGLTTVNYDLAAYLPDDSMTKRTISEMEETFGYNGTARAMVENVTVPQALAIKAQIEAVDGVQSVLWLDDVADLHQPLDTLDGATVSQFYDGEAALFQITFDGYDYDTATGETLDAIRALGIPGLHIAGTADDSHEMQALLASEVGAIFLVVIPLCLVILFLASSSWIEPPLYLSVLLVAVAINAGTNALFSGVSFITHAIAAVLQLAISLDYSLFLFHRYMEERDAGKDAREAILTASAKSINSILASALTTVAGFLALVLMRYSIGRDIGFVLAKGIAISLITVMTLMPVLIYMLRNVIEKTRHKTWIPSFRKLGKATVRLRWPILIVLLILVVPAFLGQSQNTYLYGNKVASGEGAALNSRQTIEAHFGPDNPVVLLVPTGDAAREVALAETLSDQPAVSSVQSLATLADPALPRDMLPQSVVDQFAKGDYSRIVVQLNVSDEGPAMTQAVNDIKAAAEAQYPGAWLAAGNATSLEDIRESVESDGLRVQLLSILAVALVVMFAFKSITIPILLVALIQSAIWINMSIPYFSGTTLIYIGYLIISSLQLGATIDYAILLTNRYVDERRTLPRTEAAVSALTAAAPSVLVSTLILAGAGFSFALVSQVDAISEIGLLLGRGALLSGGMVLLVLPPLLCMFDTVLQKGTLNAKWLKGDKE